jgi:hypothetical protein
MSDTSNVDPLGRTIVLHDHTWYGHILVQRLKQRRGDEFVDYRPLVESAIESPIKIEVSASDPDCRVYYGQGPRPGVMMKVFADVTLGRIRTAYLFKQFGGGIEEWPSSIP